MRRLIGLLRPDDDGVADPAPSLHAAESLVGELRDAGLAVRFVLHGDPRRLSAGVDLAGFRILQEALTNALKHAPHANVQATVSCTQEELQIEVIDDGNASPQSAGEQAGHGLLGMRERVSLYGGELVTGAREGGGFAVRARIPLEGS